MPTPDVRPMAPASPAGTETESSATNEFFSDWFTRLEESGWTAGVFLDALADDLVWTATGTSPVSGVYHGKSAYIAGVYQALDERLDTWPVPTVVRIIAQGDWAVVEFESTGGRGHNGTDYTMRYCWVMRRNGSQVTEVIGYYDTAKVVELFR